MKVSQADISIVPGLNNSGPNHWQSRWEAKLSNASRILHPDFAVPSRKLWTAAIVEAVETATRPVVLVAHSIGVASIAHAAPSLKGKVAGAFLVAMSDWNRPEVLPGVTHDFAPLPREPLPFPSMMVASRNDPYCDFEVAGDYANCWGSFLMDAGDSAHINDESGHGPWPEGTMIFARFLSGLKA
ncbi:MAG: RBBP9/YdeN family alpha/beta hydrolase [Notoacmeibacter sp.]